MNWNLKLHFFPPDEAIEAFLWSESVLRLQINVKFEQKNHKIFFFRKTSFQAVKAILNSLKTLDPLNFNFFYANNVIWDL